MFGTKNLREHGFHHDETGEVASIEATTFQADGLSIPRVPQEAPQEAPQDLSRDVSPVAAPTRSPSEDVKATAALIPARAPAPASNAGRKARKRPPSPGMMEALQALEEVNMALSLSSSMALRSPQASGSPQPLDSSPHQSPAEADDPTAVSRNRLGLEQVGTSRLVRKKSCLRVLLLLRSYYPRCALVLCPPPPPRYAEGLSNLAAAVKINPKSENFQADFRIAVGRLVGLGDTLLDKARRIGGDGPLSQVAESVQGQVEPLCAQALEHFSTVLEHDPSSCSAHHGAPKTSGSRACLGPLLLYMPVVM